MSIYHHSQWSNTHIEKANTGDARRTKCLIETAADMARRSGKSIALSCQGDEENRKELTD
ncbi:hypothetical protein JQC92_20440 [Shewanella sp. 202IG2-18]|uniref:transposase DNA-binding-containing protein n=1 Tax=Parashewanella hymeniacidonis TaxID=2807618 RepID=UPI00196206BA|nr:transposase DNA-binding-containing protein [Parashewanella hymeniacidonis]MBM7074363.1 hypothetical protein [Parashewanella hymeniacidonis]